MHACVLYGVTNMGTILLHTTCRSVVRGLFSRAPAGWATAAQAHSPQPDPQPPAPFYCTALGTCSTHRRDLRSGAPQRLAAFPRTHGPVAPRACLPACATLDGAGVQALDVLQQACMAKPAVSYVAPPLPPPCACREPTHVHAGMHAPAPDVPSTVHAPDCPGCPDPAGQGRRHDHSPGQPVFQPPDHQLCAKDGCLLHPQADRRALPRPQQGGRGLHRTQQAQRSTVQGRCKWRAVQCSAELAGVQACSLPAGRM